MKTGPAIRGVCRILNKSSCGSGSICGITQAGKSLILTNAHVAGSRVGRVVDVEVESQRKKLKARVIMAAYSDKTVSDWAVLETTTKYNDVEPTYLSKSKPSGSHYTKGFPKCRPHSGTDIETVSFGRNGVWFWEPDAIGGQSGSGVWSDNDHLQYGLLTWQWGKHGAGQQTAEIYRQARNRSTAGYPRPEGLVELDDYDFTGLDNEGCDDPIIEPGFMVETGVLDLPIWAEDQKPPQKPEDDRPDAFTASDWIEYCRDIEELHENWRNRFEANVENDTNGESPDFGLEK